MHPKENHNRCLFRLSLYSKLSPTEIPCLDQSPESQSLDMVFLVQPNPESQSILLQAITLCKAIAFRNTISQPKPRITILRHGISHASKTPHEPSSLPWHSTRSILSPTEIPCLDRSPESQPSDMVFLVHPKQNHNRYYIRLTLYAEL